MNKTEWPRNQWRTIPTGTKRIYADWLTGKGYNAICTDCWTTLTPEELVDDPDVFATEFGIFHSHFPGDINHTEGGYEMKAIAKAEGKE